MMAFVLVVAMVSTLVAGVYGLWAHSRIESLERVAATWTPRAFVALDAEPEFGISRWSWNNTIKVTLKIDRGNYKGEIVGHGATLAEAVAAAYAERDRLFTPAEPPR